MGEGEGEEAAAKNPTGQFAKRLLKKLPTHTMTIYHEAKRNQKMAPYWPQNRSPAEFGTALGSIFKMLRNAMPNTLGDRF